jgi:hypothetical protein
MTLLLWIKMLSLAVLIFALWDHVILRLNPRLKGLLSRRGPIILQLHAKKGCLFHSEALYDFFKNKSSILTDNHVLQRYEHTQVLYTLSPVFFHLNRSYWPMLSLIEITIPAHKFMREEVGMWQELSELATFLHADWDIPAMEHSGQSERYIAALAHLQESAVWHRFAATSIMTQE